MLRRGDTKRNGRKCQGFIYPWSPGRFILWIRGIICSPVQSWWIANSGDSVGGEMNVLENLGNWKQNIDAVSDIQKPGKGQTESWSTWSESDSKFRVAKLTENAVPASSGLWNITIDHDDLASLSRRLGEERGLYSIQGQNLPLNNLTAKRWLPATKLTHTSWFIAHLR